MFLKFINLGIVFYFLTNKLFAQFASFIVSSHLLLEVLHYNTIIINLTLFSLKYADKQKPAVGVTPVLIP